MKVVLIVLAIGLVPLLLFSATHIFRPVPLGDLHNYVGSSRKIEFAVGRTLSSSKGVILYPLESANFYVLLPTSSLSKFPKNPELHYAGKTLRMTAKIRQDETGYYMQLDTRQQIDEVKN